MFCKYPFPTYALSFHSINNVFRIKKVLILIKYNLSVYFFMTRTLLCLKYFPAFKSWKYPPMLS
jgi:hypothetical protein